MKLYVHSYGTGFPLVILHGLFGSHDNWHSLSKKFAAQFGVLSVDQRNHGRSPHSDAFSYELMREDLRELLDDRGLPSAFIMGHSMGGKTAMEFALTYPRMVRKLIVIDTAPKAYSRHHDHLFEALCELDLTRYQTRREVDDALGKSVPSVPVRMFLMKNLRRNEAGALEWKMNLKVLRQHYDEVLREIDGSRRFDGPALFIRGAQGNYIMDEDLPGIMTLFPNATVVPFDTGHWVHAESPGQLFEVVREFLAD